MTAPLLTEAPPCPWSGTSPKLPSQGDGFSCISNSALLTATSLRISVLFKVGRGISKYSELLIAQPAPKSPLKAGMGASSRRAFRLLQWDSPAFQDRVGSRIGTSVLPWVVSPS